MSRGRAKSPTPARRPTVGALDGVVQPKGGGPTVGALDGVVWLKGSGPEDYLRAVAVFDAFQLSIFGVLLLLAYVEMYVPGIPKLNPTQLDVVFFTAMATFSLAANLVSALKRRDLLVLLLRVEAARTGLCSLYWGLVDLPRTESNFDDSSIDLFFTLFNALLCVACLRVTRLAQANDSKSY